MWPFWRQPPAFKPTQHTSLTSLAARALKSDSFASCLFPLPLPSFRTCAAIITYSCSYLCTSQIPATGFKDRTPGIQLHAHGCALALLGSTFVLWEMFTTHALQWLSFVSICLMQCQRAAQHNLHFEPPCQDLFSRRHARCFATL